MGATPRDQVVYFIKEYGGDLSRLTDGIFTANDARMFMYALAENESGFNPAARNSIDAYGIFQLMPANRKKYGYPDTPDVAEQVQGYLRFVAADIARLKSMDGGAYWTSLLNADTPAANLAQALAWCHHQGFSNFQKGKIGPEGKKFLRGVTASLNRGAAHYGIPPILGYGSTWKDPGKGKSTGTRVTEAIEAVGKKTIETVTPSTGKVVGIAAIIVGGFIAWKLLSK